MPRVVWSGRAPRLLLDQNLAPVLARRLADLYPDSAHVREFGLATADDEAVWTHAVAHGFVIVTKDDDFRQRSALRGAPLRWYGSGSATVGLLTWRPCYVPGTPKCSHLLETRTRRCSF